MMIKSETTQGLEYLVAVDVAGVARGCTCPSRKYRPHQPCKHMRSVHTVTDVATPTPVKVPLQVPVSTGTRATGPAPQPTTVRFPANLTQHLAFAFNPGAWR
jgi:hypothetical protein